MKITSRIPGLLLAGVLFLSACSGGGAASPSQAASAVDSGGVTDIVLWQGLGKTAVELLADMIEEFNASQDSYRVSTVAQAEYDETYQKLQAAIAGNNAPAIALLDFDKSFMLDSKGLLEHFNPMMEADADFDRQDHIDVFFSQGVNADGKVYAFPAFGTTQVMYYSKAAFARHGIDPADLRTWQDLAAAARTMTVKEGGETAFYGWEPMYNEQNLIDAAFSNGGEMFSEDGRTALINTPEWVEVWEAFRGWIHDEEIMRIHFGGQGWEYWYKTIDDVLQDRAAGYTGSSGDQADLDFDKLGAFEQPGWSSNPSRPMAKVIQMVIPKIDDNAVRQGAYEFIRFFTLPENQVRWSLVTGYIVVRESSMEVPAFVEHVEDNPQVLVPAQQSLHGAVPPIDPTGNQVYDALRIAADKIEIDNVPARQALDEAQEVAQKALDEYWSKV